MKLTASQYISIIDQFFFNSNYIYVCILSSINQVTFNILLHHKVSIFQRIELWWIIDKNKLKRKCWNDLKIYVLLYIFLILSWIHTKIAGKSKIPCLSNELNAPTEVRSSSSWMTTLFENWCFSITTLKIANTLLLQVLHLRFGDR